MKRLLIIIVLITSFFGIIGVSADDNILDSLHIIDKKYFLDSNSVSREKAIIAIMRVIGVTDEEVDLLDGRDFVAFEDSAPYSYIGCAYKGKIAYGEECIVDYSTYRTSHTGKNTDFFFFPSRPVTIREALAFIIRCLEKDEAQNLDSVFEKAKTYELINVEDDFAQNIDSAITVNDFCILLERMLQQKRYKYYDRIDNVFDMSGLIDESKSITYKEMLEQRMQTTTRLPSKARYIRRKEQKAQTWDFRDE